jgi:hypothetical protein
MNWEAIGAVGEVAGAIGVIFTLGYLALQIRHSNKLATWETHHASVASHADAMSGVLNNPDVAKIYRTGLMSPDELDEIEKIRFNQLLTQLSRRSSEGLESCCYNVTCIDLMLWTKFDLSRLTSPCTLKSG